MAAKKITSTPTTDVNTTLYNETFELRDGTTLRMVVDLATIMTKVQDYTQALSDARNLPFDLDNLSARDPIIRYLLTQYEGQLKKGTLTEAGIVTRTRNYYQRALAEASSNAYLLAFFDSNENTFPNTPVPYGKAEEAPSRFVDQMPSVEKNLGFPIEATLKQILDLMVENPSVMGRIMQISEELSVRVNRVVSAGGLVETDDKGFQSGSTDGTVSEAAVPDSV